MEIKLIRDINKLGVEYINCFHLVNEVKEDWTILNKIKLVSMYVKQDVSHVVVSDINKLFLQIINVLNSYKPKEVSLSVNYEGTKYILQEDFFKLPAGWYIDSTNVDFEKVPELLPAFAYLEEGMSYAEKDKHSSIINPLKNRAEVFKRNMKVSEYLDLTGFFLLKQKQFKLSYILTQARRQGRKKKSLLNGRQSFITWLKSLIRIGKR